MSKLCKDCACENVCGITHLPEDKACVYYKAEAVTELEKIKADFEEIKGPRDNPYNNKTEYSVSMKELREVFDKHISELKGENDE